MKIALWDNPAADLLYGAAKSAKDRQYDIIRARSEQCTALLLQEQVDVALVPTTMVMKATKGLEIIPGVAISSWKYPIARLLMRGGLSDPPQRVVYDKREAEAKLITKIILQEHYGMGPAFEPLDSPSLIDLMERDEMGVLLTGEEAAGLSPSGLLLDIGQEWYELSNYPMVWGLLVAKEDRLDPEQVSSLVNLAEAAENTRPMHVEGRSHDDPLREFYSDDLRVRFDDLATASITELQKLLFYYDVLDDIPNLHFADIPEEEEQSDDQRTPLV